MDYFACFDYHRLEPVDCFCRKNTAVCLIHPKLASFCCVVFQASIIMIHHFFLVTLLLFLQVHQHPCASALIPSNKCIVHGNDLGQCKSIPQKSDIFVVADSSSSPGAEGEINTTPPSVKKWIVQGLSCNGCVERVRSFVQVHNTSYPVFSIHVGS